MEYRTNSQIMVMNAAQPRFDPEVIESGIFGA